MNRAQREAYRRRYEALKKAGEAFYPYTVYKDAVVALLVFIVIYTLAILKGAELEARADPTATSYNPRPEWYFLFLFQFLKFFPGSMEAIAAVVIPGLFILLLLVLPFIDRSPYRHPLDRPVVTGAGLAVLVGIVALTIMGARSPLVNPPSLEKPLVLEGERLVHELGCTYCHSINGRGGLVGPDLAMAPHAQDTEWLERHFENPQEVSPGSVMPPLSLLPTETRAIIAYIQDLTSTTQFSAAAPKLFEEHCIRCHRIAGRGSNKGPDLSNIGSTRDKNWLYQAIAAPLAVGLSEDMPAFQGKLDDAQMEDLARYLAAQRGAGAPAPAPEMQQVAAETAQQYTSRAPALFERMCMGCHVIAGRGIDKGPDLSAVGTYRDVEWLRRTIEDPEATIPGAEMPGFADKLSADDIVDLARYLAAQRDLQAVRQPTATPTPLALSYKTHIAPLLEAKCLKCHGGEKTYGDFDVRDYRSLMYSGRHQPVIIPGQPEQSLLYLTLIDAAEDVDRMPMSGLLAKEQIWMVRTWIEQGAAPN